MVERSSSTLDRIAIRIGRSESESHRALLSPFPVWYKSFMARRLARIGLIASLAALVSFDLTGCRRGEGPGGAPSARARPKPPKGAIVPSPGDPIPAQVTLRIGAASGLRSPQGIAVDKSGNVYVADSGNARVVKFDSSGRELTSFGKKGAAPGEFSEAWMPVVSTQGDILVLDRESTWINVFTPDGKFSRRFAGPEMGLYFPGGMAAAADGTLFLADTGGARVVKLNSGGAPQGDAIKTILGVTVKQVTDVATDSHNGVYIYQTAEKDSPSLLFYLPQPAGTETMWVVVDAPSTRESPRCVVAPDGRVYLTDPEGKQVLAYSPDGKTYRALKIEGAEAQPLQKPGGIAMDPAGRLYVVDTGANLIYRIELTSSS